MMMMMMVVLAIGMAGLSTSTTRDNYVNYVNNVYNFCIVSPGPSGAGCILWLGHGALGVPVKVHNVLVVGLEVLHRAESLPTGGLLGGGLQGLLPAHCGL